MVAAAGASYVARWTTYNVFQLMESMQNAIAKDGFSFIEIISQCPVSYGKSAGLRDAVAALAHFRDQAIHVDDAKGMSEEELEGRYVIGKLVERDRAEYTNNLADLNRECRQDIEAALAAEETP